MHAHDSPRGSPLTLSLSSSLSFPLYLSRNDRRTVPVVAAACYCCCYCRCTPLIVAARNSNDRKKKLTANGASLVRLDALSAGVACTAHLRQYSSHAGRERGRGKTRGANVKMPARAVRADCAFPASLFQRASRYSGIHFRPYASARAVSRCA